uniref:Uncharacterized protein n=1 Tax=Chenopodium quinoa TaxID=63459 RepID=A0A803MZ57_CHEQI
MSQDPSQPTPKTDEKEIPSPSTHSVELNQAWYDWMCLCDTKEKNMTAQLIIQMQKLFKKRKHPKANDMLSYKLRIIKLPFKKERQENYSGSYLMLHMKLYDSVNGIGLGTIKEEFQRLTHHHIKTVLDLLLNDNNQMQEKLLTNVKDWEEKKAQKACEAL